MAMSKMFLGLALLVSVAEGFIWPITESMSNHGSLTFSEKHMFASQGGAPLFVTSSPHTHSYFTLRPTACPMKPALTPLTHSTYTICACT